MNEIRSPAVCDQRLVNLERILKSIHTPVIVAYTFLYELESIKERINDVSTIKEDNIVERWNEGKVPVLCLHPASAGSWLSQSSECRHIIWMGLPQEIEHWLGLNGRIHNTDKNKPLTITVLLADGRVHQGEVK